MLKRLEIQNYILIDQLEIDFQPGFSVITGETGAGKSILLGALELILGNRADTQALLDKKKKCTIEGTFHIENYGLEPFFQQNDLDYDDQLILRREVGASGKSRAFINDTPVNLNQMKELGDRLVNIHSQNSTITLNQSDFQLAVLDSFAGTVPQAAGFREAYESYREKEKELAGLIDSEAKARAEEDYLLFQLEEIRNASLQEDEQQLLEEELNVLSNAEEIKENLFHAARMLSSGDSTVLDQMAEVQSLIKKISSYHPSYSTILDRLENCRIEIKDVATEISRAEGSTDFDPERLELSRQRLDLIYHLQNKHRVHTVKDLIALRVGLERDLQHISSLEDQIGKLKISLQEQKKELDQAALKLSEERRGAAAAFEMEITGLLNHMGMPDAVFKVDIDRAEQLNRDGKDRITFLFSANKGHEIRPLSDSASGGELSRVMLGIKAMISQKNLLPTIIFDEIDNGISGDIAGRVGDILAKTSTHMQLIVITHLPQIAGRAAVQYAVYKRSGGDKTLSHIIRLSEDQRVEELAGMISGREVTEAARQTAKELLSKVSIFDN